MIEVYKDFELVTMNPVFSTCMWRRRFSRPGEFQFVTHFTPDNFNLFDISQVVYMRHVDEAAFVESRNIIQTLEGELRLIIRGRSLTSLLDRRTITHSGHFDLQTLLSDIVNNNFLAGAGELRSMAPGVRLLPFSLPAINVSAEYRNRSALDAITDLLGENQIGVRVRYNFENRSFDIEFYQPSETDVVFSKVFSNIFEQDFYEDIEGYKNVVLDGDNDIHNNTTYRGFARREMAVPEPREGSQTLSQTGQDALWANSHTRTLSSTVNPFNKQFEYIKDWSLGNVVLSENREIGFSEREVITEITEFYDETGMNIEVNTGNYLERGDRRGNSNR